MPATLLFSLVLIFNVYFLFGQEPQESRVDPTPDFQISDINLREETSINLINVTRRDLRKIEEIIIPDLGIKIDSISKSLEQFTEEYIDGLTVIGIRNSTSTLDGIAKQVKSLQDNFTSNIEKLQALETSLNEEIDFWNQVYDFIKESDELTKSLTERVTNIRDNLDNIKIELTTQFNIELDNINQTSKLTSLIEGIRDLITTRETFLRNSYLLKDSEPIWRAHLVERDTTGQVKGFNAAFEENKESIRLYFSYNTGVLITHLIIVIFLFSIFRFSQNFSSSILDSPTIKRLKIFSLKPLMTAYVYSFLIIAAFDTSYPVVVMEFFLFTLFYPIYQLLKTFIKQENRKHIVIFVVLFALEIIINYVSEAYFSGRMALLFVELLTFSYLIYLLLKFRHSEKDSNRKLIYFIFALAALIFLVSILANIAGIVRLSRLLSESTINSIGLGMLIFLFFQVSKALILVLAEVRPFSALNSIQENKDRILTSFINVVRLILILLFSRAILKQYKLFKPFVAEWQEFVTKSWQLGEVSLSIGDFLNFFVMVFITIFLARFLRYLLGGEILPRFTQKRGVPNAIATSVYYIIMVIGLFLAAFSTGIEWSKVNLALGALGVGIGFGLQTLVYNFIAGLILTYERPVQVGDIVQLKTLMGSIKEIGVRSSRVLTYDGAEVVVPNGNLISDEVINWTLSSNNKRQELKFKASTNANPPEIVDILKEMVLKNPKVIREPAPLSLFEGYGDGTLDFRLLFWTHVDVGLSTKSEVALAIYDELKKRGYELPIEKRVIKLEGKDNLLRNE